MPQQAPYVRGTCRGGGGADRTGRWAAMTAGPRRARIPTINVEDCFQFGPLSRVVAPNRRDRFETRVAGNARATLDLPDARDAAAAPARRESMGEQQDA